MSSFNNTILKKITLEDKQIKKCYLDDVLVFSAGNMVSYIVDNGVMGIEEVESGNSCLSPSSIVPMKKGWTFIGWREDTTASDEVLSSKIMDNDPIVLYAVYSQTVALTFKSYDNTEIVHGTRYYNAGGNTKNATITVPEGAPYSGWNWRGWSSAVNKEANAPVAYSNGSTISNLSENNTFYGLYHQGIVCTFYSGSNKAVQATASGTRYYNAYGTVLNAHVSAPTGAAISGWSWRGWSAADVDGADAKVTYANEATISGLTGNAVFYGLYQRTITLSYNGNGNTGGSTSSQTGTRYYNSYGNYKNPSFTLSTNGYTRTAYAFTKWALGSTDGGKYAAGASVTLSEDTIFYALWKQTILLHNVTAYGAYTTGKYGAWTGLSNSKITSKILDEYALYQSGAVSGYGGVQHDNYITWRVDVTDLSTLTVKASHCSYTPGGYWDSILEIVIDGSSTELSRLTISTSGSLLRYIDKSISVAELTGTITIQLRLNGFSNDGITGEAYITPGAWIAFDGY